MAASTSSMDFASGGKFTIEFFVKLDTLNNSGLNYQTMVGRWSGSDGYCWLIDTNKNDGDVRLFLGAGADDYYNSIETADGVITADQWYHIAVVKNGTTGTIFVDGISKVSNSNWTQGNTNNSTIVQVANNNASHGSALDGQISNFRVTNGQALYTSDFVPPREELTTTSQGATASNVKILMCQSTSDATAGAVTTGTITNNGSASASAQTVALTLSLGSTLTWPSSITWNGGSAPTLLGANSYSLAGQVFNLVTYNGGTNWYGYEEVNNDNEAPNTAGKLYAWGQNHTGKLGQNSRNLPTSSGISSPVQIPGTTWDAVSGSYGVFGRKSDGTLWSWGNNSSGVLGHNQTGGASADDNQKSSPTQIPGTTWSDNIKTFDTNAIATKTDGTLWIWGSNGHGRLGLNAPETSSKSSPTQIPGTTWDTRNQKIAAGYQAQYAIKTDGTMWSWGYSAQGQLGQNQSPAGGGVEKISSPAQIGSKTNWNIVGGAWYSQAMAINTDGELWMWGTNVQGNLGQNNKTQYSSPVQVPGTTWSKLAGGQSIYYASAAIKTDGTLWMWGNNGQGQLGQNNRTYRSSPVQVAGTTWNSIACSTYCSIATKTDGTLWTWGYPSNGQLGNNQEATRYSSPVQIPGTTWTGVIYASRYSMYAIKT